MAPGRYERRESQAAVYWPNETSLATRSRWGPSRSDSMQVVAVSSGQRPVVAAGSRAVDGPRRPDQLGDLRAGRVRKTDQGGNRIMPGPEQEHIVRQNVGQDPGTKDIIRGLIH